MERAKGFEPPAEPGRAERNEVSRVRKPLLENGAGEGFRTLEPDLGIAAASSKRTRDLWDRLRLDDMLWDTLVPKQVN